MQGKQPKLTLPVNMPYVSPEHYFPPTPNCQSNTPNYDTSRHKKGMKEREKENCEKLVAILKI